MIAVALLAMTAANSVFADTYYALFRRPLSWSPIAKLGSLHLWFNDGMMAALPHYPVCAASKQRRLNERGVADHFLLQDICPGAG